jgi:transposase
MWTAKNRGRYDRSQLRYPSDLSDDEWALVESLIPAAKRGGNPRKLRVSGPGPSPIGHQGLGSQKKPR